MWTCVLDTGTNIISNTYNFILYQVDNVKYVLLSICTSGLWVGKEIFLLQMVADIGTWIIYFTWLQGYSAVIFVQNYEVNLFPYELKIQVNTEICALLSYYMASGSSSISAFEDGANRLSQNVSKKLPLLAAL